MQRTVYSVKSTLTILSTALPNTTLLFLPLISICVPLAALLKSNQVSRTQRYLNTFSTPSRCGPRSLPTDERAEAERNTVVSSRGGSVGASFEEEEAEKYCCRGDADEAALSAHVRERRHFDSLVHAFIYSVVVTPCSCGVPQHLLRWINMYAHKKAPGIMCTLATNVDWARACQREGRA
ncbi:hypothetical protein B0H16DRAFT_1453129 [Mycena metata]|uniref:Uncharacterized protein n=1 Tax=Mycena metata TaxID=1033252 RepID=A0AAD7JQG6_9AGAR|nr:hypothetical protein B0H16DRAFT_1453129 [Mycena metata]